MGLLLQLSVLTSVGLLITVLGASGQGTTVYNYTRSCCGGGGKIPINKDCLNNFIIGDRVLAVVEGTEVSALEPFLFLDEALMQVQSCVNFTHQIICDVDKNLVREEIIHHQLTPCHKQNEVSYARTLFQGLRLFFLTMAVVIELFR